MVSVTQTQPIKPRLGIAGVVLPLAGVIVLLPWFSAAGALLIGALIALSIGNPYLDATRKLTHKMLPLSIIGLGAGMNLGVVGRVGLHGVGYTLAGIAFAFILGTFLGKLFRTERDTSLLLTVGTAICGGSAIAAVASAIRARQQEVSVSLGAVFLLNAAALFLFPWLGHRLQLSETQFGLWGALAIHDTSSVVGATMQYGATALHIGTTVKLARALWIAPVTFAIGWMRSRGASEEERGPVKRPWFIVGFVVAAALVTWIPILQLPGHWVEAVAKRGLVLALFLIGSSLTRATLKSVGARPFLQALCLWLAIGSATLAAILAGWIA